MEDVSFLMNFMDLLSEMLINRPTTPEERELDPGVIENLNYALTLDAQRASAAVLKLYRADYRTPEGFRELVGLSSDVATVVVESEPKASTLGDSVHTTLSDVDREAQETLDHIRNMRGSMKRRRGSLGNSDGWEITQD